MVYALCCYLERTEMQLEKYFLNVNTFFFLMSGVFQRVLLPVNFFRDEPSQLQRCYCERTKKRRTVFGLFVHSAGVQP